MKINIKNKCSKIKNTIKPQEFYARETDISKFHKKHDGWQGGGLCPFHNDKRIGSFFINIENGAFKCFSCNAKGGDIIQFMILRDHLSFSHAIEKIAKEWLIQ